MDLTGCRRELAHQQTQQRGLARSVAASQHGTLAGAERQVHVAEQLGGPEAHAEFLDAQHVPACLLGFAEAGAHVPGALRLVHPLLRIEQSLDASLLHHGTPGDPLRNLAWVEVDRTLFDRPGVVLLFGQ